MSNYYVRRSGEDDYLEHAGWKWSKPTKYIDKFMKNGRWVYVYNQARNAAGNVRGAVRGAVAEVKRKGLGNAVADATGLTARRAYQTARRARDAASSRGQRQNANLSRAAGRAKKAYNKTLLGRIESAGTRARRAVGKAASDARAAGASFVGSIPKNAYRIPGAIRKGIDTHITGATAKRRMNVNKSRYENLSRSQNRSKNTKAALAKKNANTYEKSYRQSLAGRLDAAGDAINSWRKKGSSAAKKNYSKARTAFENASGITAKREYKEAARKGDQYGKSLQKHGKGRYSGGTFDGTSGNRGLDAARSRTVKQNSKATVAAYNRYTNTPAGVLDRYVGDPINNLRKKVKKKRRQG